MCGCGARSAAFLASLLLLVLARLDEGCVSNSMVIVTQSCTIKAGHLISKVDLNHCQGKKLQITTTDPDVIVDLDGSLYAVHELSVPSDPKTFNIEVQDVMTLEKWIIHVQLRHSVLLRRTRKRRDVLLRRQKRRWRPHPFSITENTLGPFPKRVPYGVIRSEYEQNYTIVYQISGQGVDLPPVGLFSINPTSGQIQMWKAVDREEYPVLRVTGFAKTKEGFHPELPLDLTVKVNDVNDNAPEFTKREFSVKVPECSATGTSVLNLTATDRDEPRTLHTLLSYRILSQVPPSRFGSLFSVNKKTGEIKTNNDKLDREEHERYTLKVEVRDMDGSFNGLSSTGTVVVHVTDINDHPPTFKESRYTIEVNEAESNIMVLRIPVEDKDIENTRASRAVFKIIKGNENGNFNISTDPKTNNGLLYVVKPLDAEATTSVQLEIAGENEDPLVGSSIGRQVTLVTVKVKDVDEGPKFVPSVKQLWTQEDVPLGTDLGAYTAIDPETKSSSDIRYRKLSDPADWVFIDPKTGRIRTAAVLDRESEYVKNNKYNVTVLAIEEKVPSRTGTGTVVINLNDVNDNFPVISNKDLHICENGNQHFVNVSAEDLDESPNAAPFTFLLPDKPPEIKKKWTISSQMGSYAYLKPVGSLIPGYFEVPIIIQDQQHQESKETLKIIICECPNQLHCAGRLASKKAVLGGMGILVMLLAALLLLCLLMTAFALYCGGNQKKRPPYIASGQYQQSLIVSNEEGGGQQDMNLAAMDIPITHNENVGQVVGKFDMGHETNIGNNRISTSSFGDGMTRVKSGSQMVTQEIIGVNDGMHYDRNGVLIVDQVDYGDSGVVMEDTYTFGRRRSHGLMEILRSQVDQVYEEEQEEIGVGFNHAHEYTREGRNSVSGSVGCSDVVETSGLDYLNNLGPKFRPSVSLKN